ncbi:hypothetical protein [Klebsiella oxytoca]|uniref:hypothetical protein n=1 Tax=Klebsiella oxytoca TaxID=571 RepID=UPI001ED99C5B|nr:hypothetical protein [Klebsiella oxytoca]
MKRFSWGLLTGLAALAISPQTMAETGWCETTTSGKVPFRNTFSFIETFTNPAQNQAGMTFPRLYRWNTGGDIMQNVIVAAMLLDQRISKPQFRDWLRRKLAVG